MSSRHLHEEWRVIVYDNINGYQSTRSVWCMWSSFCLNCLIYFATSTLIYQISAAQWSLNAGERGGGDSFNCEIIHNQYVLFIHIRPHLPLAWIYVSTWTAVPRTLISDPEHISLCQGICRCHWFKQYVDRKVISVTTELLNGKHFEINSVKRLYCLWFPLRYKCWNRFSVAIVIIIDQYLTGAPLIFHVQYPASSASWLSQYEGRYHLESGNSMATIFLHILINYQNFIIT